MPRSDWPKTLSRWAGCNIQRASDLLAGKCSAQEIELQNVAGEAGYSADELLGDLLGQDVDVNILQENIYRLLNALPYGEGQRVAEVLGVDQRTLSRWRNKEGKKGPQGSNWGKLAQEFFLPPGTNLQGDPLFLSPDPIGAIEQRAWLRKRIDEIGSDYLMRIFPSLEKLLEE